MYFNQHLLVVACLLGVSTAWASPAFKSVEFVRHSTKCSAGNAGVTLVPDGSGVSVLFGGLKAEATSRKRDHDRLRCDVIFKLAAPVDAPTRIQLDVRGAISVVGKARAGASIAIQGRKNTLALDSLDPAKTSFVTTIPKGAKKLEISFTGFAKGKYPASSALVAIDSVDVIFKR